VKLGVSLREEYTTVYPKVSGLAAWSRTANGAALCY